MNENTICETPSIYLAIKWSYVILIPPNATAHMLLLISLFPLHGHCCVKVGQGLLRTHDGSWGSHTDRVNAAAQHPMLPSTIPVRS